MVPREEEGFVKELTLLEQSYFPANSKASFLKTVVNMSFHCASPSKKVKIFIVVTGNLYTQHTHYLLYFNENMQRF